MLSRLDVYDLRGTVVYSDDRSRIGTRPVPPESVRAVLSGEAVRPVLITDAELGPLLTVTLTMHPPGRQDVIGVAELFVPYQPVLDGIEHDARRVVGFLLAGLALLWVTLFHLVLTASRRLRGEVERNEHQALHDALTGLPNRSLLFDRIERAAARAQRSGTACAVLLLDLDRFKEVNDTLGHHNGDRLLCEVAARFAARLRDTDTLARLGGDEFSVLLPDVGDERAAAAVAARLLASLDAAIDLDGVAVSVGVSIGIALCPRDGDTPEVLLQRADVAMYQAKGTSEHVAVYCKDNDHHTPERLSLLGDLRQGLQREELVLHFQPQADPRTGTVRGFEALVRWQHPERGLVGPGTFIPLAEQAGLMEPVTLHVLEQALLARQRWAAAGHDLTVSVNVSARNVGDRAFPARVAYLLGVTGAPAGRLVVELTESMLVHDPDAALEVLHELKRLGVLLSIDDYGSGYSSLERLRQLPVDELKIDRQFVSRLADHPVDQAIVRSTVELGASLGLVNVAEGVEDAATWHHLAALGCTLVQGYHLSRPLAGDAVLPWLAGQGVGTDGFGTALVVGG